MLQRVSHKKNRKSIRVPKSSGSSPTALTLQAAQTNEHFSHLQPDCLAFGGPLSQYELAWSGLRLRVLEDRPAALGKHTGGALRENAGGDRPADKETYELFPGLVGQAQGNCVLVGADKGDSDAECCPRLRQVPLVQGAAAGQGKSASGKERGLRITVIAAA